MSKRSIRRGKKKLTQDQLFSLCDSLLDSTSHPPFKDDVERRTAWIDNKDKTIRAHISSNKAWPLYGTRPESFFDYDFPNHKDLYFKSWRDGREPQFRFLKERGLLLEGEEEAFIEQSERLTAILKNPDYED